MIKMLFGAAVVVALVGYGVVTPSDVERAGDRVVNGVNTLAKTVDEATR
jgi:hypothetical protein